MKYQQADGGFSHNMNVGKSQEMSTVQVLQALDAYRSGKTTYWAVKGEYVSVMVSVLGDEVHNSDEDGQIHVLSRNNLTVWAAQAEYRVAKASTAMEAIDAALAAAGMTCEKRYEGTYISSATNSNGVKLGEFTNGKKSGWLYSVNGKDADVGACDYKLSDGDEIIFHYTDNYTKENTSADHQHSWGSGTVIKDEPVQLLVSAYLHVNAERQKQKPFLQQVISLEIGRKYLMQLYLPRRKKHVPAAFASRKKRETTARS